MIFARADFVNVPRADAEIAAYLTAPPNLTRDLKGKSVSLASECHAHMHNRGGWRSRYLNHAAVHLSRLYRRCTQNGLQRPELLIGLRI